MEKQLTAADWLRHYKDLKQEFWRVVVGLIIVVSVIIVATMADSHDKLFSEAIAEYEQTTGRKIYPSGREFLRKAAEKQGLQTKDEVLSLIKYNEKFMWK